MKATLLRLQEMEEHDPAEGPSAAGATGGRRGEGRASAVSAPGSRPPRRPGNASPAPTASHRLYRISGASEGSCPARRPKIRPLFPPGTSEPQLTKGGSLGSRKRGPGAEPAATSGLRRRRPGKPGAAGFLRPAAALSWPQGAMARPLPRSGSRCWAGGGGAGQPGRPAKRCVFPGPRGPGEPCVFARWEWLTGKLDGRYPANRHALYCLGANSLESKYQLFAPHPVLVSRSRLGMFPLVRGLKMSHENPHPALAEVRVGCWAIPPACPRMVCYGDGFFRAPLFFMPFSAPDSIPSMDIILYPPGRRVRESFCAWIIGGGQQVQK
ncbi:hypothetical protein AAY473_021156 [Plecturocebus cupreus]